LLCQALYIIISILMLMSVSKVSSKKHNVRTSPWNSCIEDVRHFQEQSLRFFFYERCLRCCPQVQENRESERERELLGLRASLLWRVYYVCFCRPRSTTRALALGSYCKIYIFAVDLGAGDAWNTPPREDSPHRPTPSQPTRQGINSFP